MGSNDSLVSGERYTLSSLLGGEIQLVIPDMQRDYCWGVSEGGRAPAKAPIFVRSLVKMYTERRTPTLGLLYGYEMPAGSCHIHIIDGQQRLTTLYLLVGMLYRRVPSVELRRLLISDYELLDDREPRILYQARSEAMYFLSDLVTNFFLNRDGRLSQLEQSAWYHNVYDSDPTVQSFVSALRLIDAELEAACVSADWDFGEFARFVCGLLTFVYHDLGERPQAERMFITVNTTGQPLTGPQRYKAVMLASDADRGQAVERWEEMEHWAWVNRAAAQASTSDPMIERVLRLYSALVGQDYEAALSSLRFDSLYQFFCNYRALTEYIPEALELGDVTPYHIFMVLPSVKFIKKWSYDKNQGPTPAARVREFWDFLYYYTRYQKIAASGVDLHAAYALVEKLPRPDLASLLTCSQPLPERLLNAEQRAKLTFITASGDRRRALDLLNKAQSHPMLSGRARSIISWCMRRGQAPDLKAFARYTEALYQVWGTDISERADLDDVRRALLSLRHPGYPIVRRGETSLSLCWHDYDWQRLMSTSPAAVRLLLDRVINSKIPAIDTLRKMAHDFTDRVYPYYFLIRDQHVLSEVGGRMLLCPSQPFLGFYPSGKGRRHGATRWYVEQIVVHPYPEEWAPMRTYGTRCIYTDHRRWNLAIDLYYTPDQRWTYRVEVFSRTDAPASRPPFPDIEGLLRSLGYPMRYDRKRKRYCTGHADAKSVVKMLDDVMRRVGE